MNNNLNKYSSTDEKRNASEAVFEALSDVLFDKVNLLNNPNTAVSSAVGSPNTSTTNFAVALRIPDTASGNYMRPDKKSRLRTMFDGLVFWGVAVSALTVVINKII